jgi:hypothetical protein
MITLLANLHNSYSQSKCNILKYKEKKNQNKITYILPCFDWCVQFFGLEVCNNANLHKRSCATMDIHTSKLAIVKTYFAKIGKKYVCFVLSTSPITILN